MESGSTGVQVQHRIALEMICPYEPGMPIEEVRRRLGLTSVIKLASNENPLGPSPHVLHTLNSSNLELHMYPDYEGHSLREALSRALRVSPAEILTGAGSTELMRLLAEAYVDKDDEGLVCDACFPVYAHAIRIAGGQPVEVPLDSRMDYDLERMLAAVTPRTKIVFLASPNNPTGRRIPSVDLKAFLERLPPRVLCVLDLAYGEYCREPPGVEPVRLLARHPNLVLLRTFSKVYGLAGLRVGYAVAANEIIQDLNRVRIPFSTSTAAQVAARAALEDTGHVEKAVALNESSREVLTRGLDWVGLRTFPSEANFVLVDVGRDPEEVFSSLLARGIVVRPVRSRRLPTCLRITTGTGEQMDAVLAALGEALAAGPAQRDAPPARRVTRASRRISTPMA
jgi:histidinol-phosphate aminotransferase